MNLCLQNILPYGILCWYKVKYLMVTLHVSSMKRTKVQQCKMMISEWMKRRCAVNEDIKIENQRSNYLWLILRLNIYSIFG